MEGYYFKFFELIFLHGEVRAVQVLEESNGLFKYRYILCPGQVLSIIWQDVIPPWLKMRGRGLICPQKKL